MLQKKEATGDQFNNQKASNNNNQIPLVTSNPQIFDTNTNLITQSNLKSLYQNLDKGSHPYQAQKPYFEQLKVQNRSISRDLKTIDFFSDLIPLLRNRYGAVFVNKDVPQSNDNLLEGNTQPNQQTQKNAKEKFQGFKSQKNDLRQTDFNQEIETYPGSKDGLNKTSQIELIQSKSIEPGATLQQTEQISSNQQQFSITNQNLGQVQGIDNQIDHKIDDENKQQNKHESIQISNQKESDIKFTDPQSECLSKPNCSIQQKNNHVFLQDGQHDQLNQDCQVDNKQIQLECSNLRLSAYELQNNKNHHEQRTVNDIPPEQLPMDSKFEHGQITETNQIEKLEPNNQVCYQVSKPIEQFEPQQNNVESQQKLDKKLETQNKTNKQLNKKFINIRVVGDPIQQQKQTACKKQQKQRSTFELSIFSKQTQQFLNSSEYVLVSYRMVWIDGVTEIADQFLWPKQQRDIKSMKMFALDFLSDIFGFKSLSQHLNQHVNQFACFIAYIINREIDLNDHLSTFSPWSMVQDGKFNSIGNELDFNKEQLVQIDLNLPLVNDCFLWDISNPDNNPETFAYQLVHDLKLQPALEYSVAIALEIRKQIQIYICQKVQGFSHIYENYLQFEIDQHNQQQHNQPFENSNSFDANNIQYPVAVTKQSNQSNFSDKFMKEDQFSSFNDSLKSFIEENCLSQENICSLFDGQVTTNLPESKENSNGEMQPQYSQKNQQLNSNQKSSSIQIKEQNIGQNYVKQQDLQAELIKKHLSKSTNIYGPSEVIYQGSSIHYKFGCGHKLEQVPGALKNRMPKPKSSHDQQQKSGQMENIDAKNKLPNCLRMQPNSNTQLQQQQQHDQYQFLAQMVLKNKLFKPINHLDQITEQLQLQAQSIFSKGLNDYSSKDNNLINETQGFQSNGDQKVLKKNFQQQKTNLGGTLVANINQSEEAKQQETYKNEKIFCVLQDREHSKNKPADNPFQSYHSKDLEPLLIDDDDDYITNAINNSLKSNGQVSQLNTCQVVPDQPSELIKSHINGNVNNPNDPIQNIDKINANQYTDNQHLNGVNSIYADHVNFIEHTKIEKKMLEVNTSKKTSQELSNLQTSQLINDQQQIQRQNSESNENQLETQNGKCETSEHEIQQKHDSKLGYLNQQEKQFTDSKTLPNGTIIFQKIALSPKNLIQNKIEVHQKDNQKNIQIQKQTQESFCQDQFDNQIINQNCEQFNTKTSGDNVLQHQTDSCQQDAIDSLIKKPLEQKDFGLTSMAENTIKQEQKQPIQNGFMHDSSDNYAQQHIGNKRTFQEHQINNRHQYSQENNHADANSNPDKLLNGNSIINNHGLIKQPQNQTQDQLSSKVKQDTDDILEPEQKRVQLGFADLSQSQPVNNQQPW